MICFAQHRLYIAEYTFCIFLATESVRCQAKTLTNLRFVTVAKKIQKVFDVWESLISHTSKDKTFL